MQQRAAKELVRSDDPIARRTRSHSARALDVALAATLELDATLASPRRMAGRRLPKALFETALAVMDIETGKMMKYRHLITHVNQTVREQWTTSSANEFGRLFQGVGGRIKNPTNTCYFVKHQDVPEDRRKDVTYGKFECSVRPQKVDEPNRIRLVLGGNSTAKI